MILGLVILAIIVIVGYLAIHHVKQPAPPAAKDLAATLAASATDTWEALKRDLPAIVSAENASLRQALADMEARAVQAEQKVAAEQQASIGRLEAVKAQVGSVIAGIGVLPASAVPVAAVAAAQADDVAAVRAATASLSPALNRANLKD